MGAQGRTHAAAGPPRATPPHEQVVISLQKSVERLPDTEIHVWYDVAHPLPEFTLLPPSSRLPVSLALATNVTGALLFLLVRGHILDAEVFFLRDESPQLLQYFVGVNQESLI